MCILHSVTESSKKSSGNVQDLRESQPMMVKESHVICNQGVMLQKDSELEDYGLWLELFV